MDIVVTGANGAVGTALVSRLGKTSPVSAGRVRALVRSAQRARSLRALAAEVIEVDYNDARSLGAAMAGARAVVHLAGALVPRRGETLIEANGGATRAVVNAASAAGAQIFVYLSFPGAGAAAENLYLRSKGMAEDIIRRADFSGAIFRVPMILGPRSPSFTALARMAAAPFVPLVGGGSVRLQPIAQSDVLAAIRWALAAAPKPMPVLDLVGPETVSYAELVRGIARRLGKNPKILHLPKAAVRLSAAIAGGCLPGLGWNYSVFDTLFNEHLADPGGAGATLGLRLTPVDEMLDRSLSAAS